MPEDGHNRAGLPFIFYLISVHRSVMSGANGMAKRPGRTCPFRSKHSHLPYSIQARTGRHRIQIIASMSLGKSVLAKITVPLSLHFAGA
jgi:hypothetical protein